MATIYTRTSKYGTLKYYGNLSIKGKRVRRFLGHSKPSAYLALKKLEYEYFFIVLISKNPTSVLNMQSCHL